jgi:F0F1-type ATP synthase assembly protein I
MNARTTHKNTLQQMHQYGYILMLSAYGFVIVIASLLFLYLGYLLDEWLGTAPNFMLGLFFLAIATTIMRLYQEAWLKHKSL